MARVGCLLEASSAKAKSSLYISLLLVKAWACLYHIDALTMENDLRMVSLS